LAARDDTGARPALDFALSFILLALTLCGMLAAIILSIWAHDVPHAYKDVLFANWLHAHASPDLTAVMQAASFMGDIRAIAVTVPLLALLLVLLRRPMLGLIQAATLLMSVGGGIAIATTLKPVVARLGPGATAAPTGGPLAFNHYAFPSGHAVYFLTCFVPLAWFLWEWRPHGLLAWRALATAWRVLICLSLLALTALGGLSQIYLGYHWPTDVAGGYAIGGFWSALVLLVYLRFGHGLATSGRMGGQPAAAVAR
jgi:undecaprenyl-diphosphatase